MPIYFWQGGKIVGGRGCRKGQGHGGKRGGGRGWGNDGGGEGGGEGGWGEALIEVLNKTAIVTSDQGVGTHVPIRNRNEIVGNPRFWGNAHCNDITFSKTRHNLAKKSPKMRMREISLVCDCARRKEVPS